jgi:hypothetical protein
MCKGDEIFVSRAHYKKALTALPVMIPASQSERDEAMERSL